MWNYSNTSVQTVLTAPIGPSDTNIQIGSTSGLPVTFPFSLILDYQQATVEVVTVTGLVGSNLTVIRAQDGTSAQTHSANAAVVHGVVARDLQDPQNHIAAATNVHGVGAPSAVVGTATTQVLTNKSLDGNANTFTNIPSTGITSLDASKVTQPFGGLQVVTPGAGSTALTVTSTEAARSVPVATIAAQNNAVNIDEDGTVTLDRGDLNVDAARAHAAPSLVARIFAKATNKVGLLIQKNLVGDAFNLLEWRDQAGTTWGFINSLGQLQARRLTTKRVSGDTGDLLDLQDETGANLAKVDKDGKLTAANLISLGVITASADINVSGNVVSAGETWHPITFSNGWVNGGGVVAGQYRKLASPANCVQLVGSFTPGTKADGTPVFTLPVGYRPLSSTDVPASVNALATQSPHFSISNAGLVACWGCSNATTVSIAAIFPTDA